MLTASENFLKALQNPIKELYIKLEFYTNTNQYLFEITKLVTQNDLGSLSIALDRPIRRSFSFVLDNSDGKFTFGENKIVWLNKLVKLSLGLKLNDNSIEYVPQGVFRLTNLSDSNGIDGKKAFITGVDKMSKYTDQQGQFVNQLTISAGANIATAIKIIANDETMFNFDTIIATVPYEITFQAGSSKYDAMKQLADLAMCQLYYDEYGYMRLKNINLNDISNYPPVWSFIYNDKSERFYAGNIRKLDTNNLSNHILVVGGSSQTGIVSYELKVDETDPIWTGNSYSIQQIGDYLYMWNNGNPDPVITTVDECKYRAKWLLMKKLGYSQKVSLNISPFYLLDVGDIIQIEDSSNDVTGRYLIESINMPLQPQLMSIECAKEIQIISDWNFI